MSKKTTFPRIFVCETENECSDIENEIKQAKEKIAKGEIYRSTWSCGDIKDLLISDKQLHVGEKVYFKRVGNNLNGFFADGRIVAAEKEAQTRLKNKKYKNLSATYSGEYPTLRFTYEWYSVADYDQPLYLEQTENMCFALRESCYSGIRFNRQEHVERFEYYWEQHLAKLSQRGYSVQLAHVHREGQYKNAAIEELAAAQKRVEAEGYFTPKNSEDARKRTTASIIRRQGQPQFRQALLQAYGGKCAITRCDVEQTLEAAHIMPYFGSQTNHISNGLLLRADIHKLFDLYLITIDPDTMRVLVAPTIKHGDLNCIPLHLPGSKYDRPSQEALESRRDLCVWAKDAWNFPVNKTTLLRYTMKRRS